MIDDEKLQREIHEALVRDRRVSSRVVGVEVRNGIVTLLGAAQSYRRVLAAIEIAASFAACHGVINRLRIRSVRQMNDGELADLVRAVLEAHPEIGKETITVSVRDGKVELRGTVSNIEQGLIAEDVVLGIGGVRAVRNLLLCDLLTQVEDARVSHDCATALEMTPGLRGADLHVAFDGDQLVLAGSVAEAWQKELAENVVSQFRPNQVRNAISVG